MAYGAFFPGEGWIIGRLRLEMPEQNGVIEAKITPSAGHLCQPLRKRRLRSTNICTPAIAPIATTLMANCRKGTWENSIMRKYRVRWFTGFAVMPRNGTSEPSQNCGCKSHLRAFVSLMFA